MNFDDKLREMAKDDHIPLPDGYDEMLTGLYNSLAAPGQEEASHGKEAFPVKTHAFRLTRLLAAVAVIALMIASMAVGALAFSQDTIVEIPVEVEVPVEVPVEQETIVMEELGLTLVLPDSWKDKYVVEYYDGGEFKVYSKYVYDNSQVESGGRTRHGGTLFWFCIGEPMTAQELDERSPVPCRYLFTTIDSTYFLMYVSDVQYDPEDSIQTEEYLALFHTMQDIRVIVDGITPQAQGGSSGL